MDATVSRSDAPQSAHVIVLGNEKGGSGKTTTAFHLIVGLLKAGHAVASIDTDGRQKSLTRMIENRARWAHKNGLRLDLPVHYVVAPADGETVREAEAREFEALIHIVARVERRFDFVVIDTPASDSYLMRLSHSFADTLVTPINDSFVDLDVLGRGDPEHFTVSTINHYAELVREARRQRLLVDGAATRWVVVRNRIASLSSRSGRHVASGLAELATLLDFRVARGISERVIFREFFPMGLTALDAFDRRTLGGEPTLSHLAARQEVRELIDCLDLPGCAWLGRAAASADTSVEVPASPRRPQTEAVASGGFGATLRQGCVVRIRRIP